VSDDRDGFLITGLVLLVLALLVPVVAANLPDAPQRPILAMSLMPREILDRATFPFVLIAIALCVLAWAERSVVLAVVAAAYLALSLVASLYSLSNVVGQPGWHLGPATLLLPNVVLPALVLLLSGAGAWAAQRWHRAPRSAGPAGAGPG
jgi:hypothetical protein